VCPLRVQRQDEDDGGDKDDMWLDSTSRPQAKKGRFRSNQPVGNNDDDGDDDEDDF
jgi:hypothetical protein